MARGQYKAGQVWPTNNYGDIIIVEYRNWDNVFIKFLETGYEKRVCMSSVKKGGVRDDSVDNIPSDMVVGITHPTNNYGDLRVIKYYNWDNVKVEFLLTGNERSVRADDIRAGCLRDRDSEITATKLQKHIGDKRALDNGNVLTITDYLHKSEVGNHYFSVECSSCSNDKELHPSAFKTSTVNWKGGCVPCPCSNSYFWSSAQYKVLIDRQFKDSCWSLKGDIVITKGNTTKVDVHCSKHNRTHKVNIINILEGKSPCKTCTEFKVRRSRTNTCIERYSLAGTKEVFYILRFTGKGVSFIKSGICVFGKDVLSSVELRYLKGDYTGFTYEVLHTEVGCYEDISDIEINSQEDNQAYRFNSYTLKGFSGYSECFTEFHYNDIVYK